VSDETKTGAELEAEQLLGQLAEQLANATPAPEPGSQRPGEVIAKTLEDNGENIPLPMMVANRQVSAGYTWVYDTETGAPSRVNNNMLRMQLRKTRLGRDGQQHQVFTTIKPDPSKMPKLGTIKCLLHPDHPDRGQLADFNFDPCHKTNIVSKYSLDTHMKNRHPQEWATILEVRERAEREEEKAHRRAILELASRGVVAEPERRTRKVAENAGAAA
jgi:hypothetical protein